MGYRTAPPPLPGEADGGGNGETPDTPPAGDARTAPPPPPGRPAAHRDRRWWDREYGSSARAAHRPPERPGRTEPDANPAEKAPRPVADRPDRKAAVPGVDPEAEVEAARRTGFIAI